MPDNKLSDLEVYCPNQACGDLVTNLNGTTITRRRMNYAGTRWNATAAYICPVCGKERRFLRHVLSTGYKELS
jgi:hypothetical protein